MSARVLGQRDLTCLAEDVDKACISTKRFEDRRWARKTILGCLGVEKRECQWRSQQRVYVQRKGGSHGTIECKASRRAKSIQKGMPVVRLEHWSPCAS
jgi:hypothetical protein